MDDIDDSAEYQATKRISSFFDDVYELLERYGDAVLDVRDASEMYPILSRSAGEDGGEDNMGCPFDYVPMTTKNGGRGRHTNDNNDGMVGSAETDEGGAAHLGHPRPCHTPIVTMRDVSSNARVKNDGGAGAGEEGYVNPELPEVLLVGGMTDRYDADGRAVVDDAYGPMSIYAVLDLLLESARCESLSPWSVATEETMTTTSSTAADAETENEIEGGDINEDDVEVDEALLCRRALNEMGIDDAIRRWLARLVATRTIVAVPIADVAGLHAGLVRVMSSDDDDDGGGGGGGGRMECDFPLPFLWNGHTDASTPAMEGVTNGVCMTTYPSRLMNEIFRSHAFRLGLSFHGASSSSSSSVTDDVPIASRGGRIYIPGWNVDSIDDDGSGSPSPRTPDEGAMVDIATAYGAFGGRLGRDDLHYSVAIDRPSSTGDGGDVGGGGGRCGDGGGFDRGATLEHFAFSAGMASADGVGANDEGSSFTERCRCSGDKREDGGDTNTDEDDGGGCSYPSERTGIYDGSSLRTFVARVPRVDDRNHDDLASFGLSQDPSNTSGDSPSALFDRGALGVNIRMSLLATELVEPYTAIRSIAGVSLKDDDIVPMTPRPPGGCSRTRSMMMPESTLMKNTTITWTVGGALSVTETAIMYGKSSVLDRKIFDCVTQPVSAFARCNFRIISRRFLF